MVNEIVIDADGTCIYYVQDHLKRYADRSPDLFVYLSIMQPLHETALRQSSTGKHRVT